MTQLTVRFYEQAEDALLKFAVILARHRGQWVFCRHRQRSSWEVPGGHRAPGETIAQTAARELTYPDIQPLLLAEFLRREGEPPLPAAGQNG